MKIIISPAKTMNTDPYSLGPETVPPFSKETEQIKSALDALSDEELQKLWKVSDKLASLNIERLRSMQLENAQVPAIYSYEGLQFQNMAPYAFQEEQLDYVKNHLRILSGFYGIVRPFDGVVPYRLEMQSKLKVNGAKNLYDFWGSKLADNLTLDSKVIINLASKEYSDAIVPHLPANTRFVTCIFCQKIDGKLKEKGTLCKMARGKMVRYMAENNITNVDEIKNFNELDFVYSKEDSTDNLFTYIQNAI